MFYILDEHGGVFKAGAYTAWVGDYNRNIPDGETAHQERYPAASLATFLCMMPTLVGTFRVSKQNIPYAIKNQ